MTTESTAQPIQGRATGATSRKETTGWSVEGKFRCGLCGGGLVWGTHNCEEKQKRSHCSAVLSPPALSSEH